jgi:fructuronate reductase/mannitol 2-dehydrogenase
MSAPIPLRADTLDLIAGRVDVPRYDRVALTPGVVHISVGSFHRSHQAVYFDDLARLGHTGWGLIGVGLRRPEMREALGHQHGLYTVVSRGRAGDRARVVGALRRYLFAPDDGPALGDALANPRTRLVTLTITGTGYGVDPATGALSPTDPAALAESADPTQPRTAIGLIVDALDRRRKAGRAPFTVLSCDNVPDNGRIARTAVAGRAALRDPQLAAWIEEHGAFPSSMVDRITPQTTEADRELVARQFGVLDRWPVITEPYSEWIVEDEFSNGRPPLDEVGVRFTNDTRPYALLKTRMLNASHCALGHLGSLAGYGRTDEAMADPLFFRYLERMMADEIAPLLPRVPGIDIDSYRRTTLERIANPALGDQLERLSRAASGKVPRHIVPSIVSARERGGAHALLTLALAGWLRYLRGMSERGRPLLLDDPLGPHLQELALEGGTDPRALLAERGLFGALSGDETFAAELEDVLVALERHGVRATVQDHLRDQDRRVLA